MSSPRFEKGKSGNPGGRPKGAEARARAVAESRSYTAANGQEYTGSDAMLHVLIDIATDAAEKSRERIAAANSVLDRVEGKPRQAVDVSGAPDPTQFALLEALRMTPQERRNYLQQVADEDEKALAEGPLTADASGQDDGGDES